MSGKVRDGVLGKIIYAVIALSGYAVLARNEQFVLSPSAAGATLQISRVLNCEHCLRCNKAPGGIDRRKQ